MRIIASGWTVKDGFAWQGAKVRSLMQWSYEGLVVRCWPTGPVGHVAILLGNEYFSARPDKDAQGPRHTFPIEPIASNDRSIRLASKQTLFDLARDKMDLVNGKPVRVPVITPEADKILYTDKYLDVPIPFLDTVLAGAMMRRLQLSWDELGPVESYRLYDIKGQPGSRNNCISRACRVLEAGLSATFDPKDLEGLLGFRHNTWVRNFVHNLGLLGILAAEEGLLEANEGYDLEAYTLLTELFPRVG